MIKFDKVVGEGFDDMDHLQHSKVVEEVVRNALSGQKGSKVWGTVAIK